MKKFVCSVCGYVHEGDSAPEFCPQCKAPAAKFVEKVENGEKLSWATEHHVGDGKVEDKEVLERSQSSLYRRMHRSRHVSCDEPSG